MLTAAHCVGDPAAMAVRANSSWAFGGGELLGVSSAVRAPGFRKGFESDLAVLILTTPTSAPAIELATPAEDAAYTRPERPSPWQDSAPGTRWSSEKRKFGLLTAAGVRRQALPGPRLGDLRCRAGASASPTGGCAAR